MRLSSPTLRVRGLVTPSISTCHASGLSVTDALGGATLLRTNRMSLSVMLLVPKALRLVSMPLAL